MRALKQHVEQFFITLNRSFNLMKSVPENKKKYIKEGKMFFSGFILVAGLSVLASFRTQQQKPVTLTVTPQEVELIYEGLSELPAKRVDALRQKIVSQYQAQISDTTGKKK